MKKTILMAFAAVAMIFTACSNSTASNEKAQEGAEGSAANEIPAGFAKYENNGMSFIYPDKMHVGFEMSEGVKNVNIDNEDGSCKLAVTFNEDGPTESQLEESKTNYEAMLKALQETVTSSEVKDNVVIVRSNCEGVEKICFLVHQGGTKCLNAQFTFPTDSASVYNAYLEPIIKSMKK